MSGHKRWADARRRVTMRGDHLEHQIRVYLESSRRLAVSCRCRVPEPLEVRPRWEPDEMQAVYLSHLRDVWDMESPLLNPMLPLPANCGHPPWMINRAKALCMACGRTGPMRGGGWLTDADIRALADEGERGYEIVYDAGGMFHLVPKDEA